MRSFRQSRGLKSNSLLEVVAQEAIAGIMVFDPDTLVCTHINRVASEALAVGFNQDHADETNDLLLSELFPHQEEPSGGRPRAFSEKMFREGGHYQDILIRKRDGLTIIANVAIKHLTEENGERLSVVMFQDITVQKKMQRDLEFQRKEIRKAYMQVLKQNRELRELDSAKNRFIALTTHELRTPLSAIVAMAEALHLKLCDSEEQREQFIGMLYEQSVHLMELVNDILDYAKIRAGKMDLFVEHLDLGSAIKKMVVGFEQMAAQYQVTLETIGPQEEIMVYADALRLREVIGNVINNAIKFNRPGGRVTIRYFVLKEKNLARITVEDTGVGIPPERLPHVFNEFETVGHVSQHHKGTGLGMPISKHLIEAMGGSISLKSVEGEGTTFYIDVPTEKVLSPEVYRSRADSWGGDQAAA